MCVSVVVVNWNSGKQLRNCIDSVIAFGGNSVGSVVVVDNGSADGSENTVEGLPKVKLIRAGENLGFGKACNLGSQHASSEYLLFLNPDAALYPDTLSRVLAFMNDPVNARVGICGVQLIDELGESSTSAARFPTLRVMIGTIFGLTRVFPKIFPSHLISSFEFPVGQVVDQVIGAFFFIRTKLFNMCNGFDERFFVYFEEVDLSLRVKQIGFSSYVIADVTAFHSGGGCTGQVKSARLFYSLRSRLLFAQKHFSLLELFGFALLTLVELPLRLFRGIYILSKDDCLNTCRAYWQLVKFVLWRK